MRKLKAASMAATVLVAGLATVASGLTPAVAAAAPGGAAAPARAQGSMSGPTNLSVTLPLQQFGLVGEAVDAKHHHLYFTDGTKLLVTDLAGGVVTSIPLTDAGKVALAPDDGALYVATGTFGRTIVQIDTSTLTVTRSFTVDSTLNLTGLAASGSRLWYIANVASTCIDGPFLCKSGAVGSFDLGSSSTTGTFTVDPGGHAPIAVTASARTLVVAYQAVGAGPYDIDVYDASQAGLTATASAAFASESTQFAITPDGKDLVTDAGELLDLSNLAVLVHYTGLEGGEAPAVSSQGTVAFGYNDLIGVNPTTGQDIGTIGVRTYASNIGASPLQNIVLESADPDLGILYYTGFSPDGRSLYAVTDDANKARGTTDAFTLHILGDPQLAQPAITTNVKPYFVVTGQPIAIPGTITAAIPVRPGSVLHVTRSSSPSGQGGTPIPDAIVGQNGTFTIKDAPQAPKAIYWYTVSYAGDCQHLSASTSNWIEVYPPTKLTLVAPKTDVAGTSMKITGAVTNGPYGLSGTFKVYVTRIDAAHPNGVALPVIPLPANFFFSFTDKPTTVGPTTYRVSFNGGNDLPSATTTATVNVTSAP